MLKLLDTFVLFFVSRVLGVLGDRKFDWAAARKVLALMGQSTLRSATLGTQIAAASAAVSKRGGLVGMMGWMGILAAPFFATDDECRTLNLPSRRESCRISEIRGAVSLGSTDEIQAVRNILLDPDTAFYVEVAASAGVAFREFPLRAVVSGTLAVGSHDAEGEEIYVPTAAAFFCDPRTDKVIGGLVWSLEDGTVLRNHAIPADAFGILAKCTDALVAGACGLLKAKAAAEAAEAAAAAARAAEEEAAAAAVVRKGKGKRKPTASAAMPIVESAFIDVPFGGRKPTKRSGGTVIRGTGTPRGPLQHQKQISKHWTYVYKGPRGNQYRERVERSGSLQAKDKPPKTKMYH